MTALSVSTSLDPLLLTGALGHVVRVHRTAVDVRIDGESLVLLAREHGDEPHGIRVSDIRRVADRSAPGDLVRVRDGLLRIGREVAISLAGRPWQPRLDPIAPVALVRGSAIAAARARSRPRLSFLDAVLDRHLATLDSHLRVRDDVAAVDAGCRLIGLGPGLTPAGDDILVGLTAMLRALGDVRAASFACAWAGAAPGGTTDLAVTFHRHAARSEYAARLHDLVRVLIVGPGSAIPGALARTVAWGSTSGADTLRGVALALDGARPVQDLAA